MTKYSIIILCVIFLMITQFFGNTQASELSFETIPDDFIYDGCSMFPDGDYRDCCTNHDTDYFFGGTGHQRLRSDNTLAVCVMNKGGVGHKILGPIMWTGVRIGGAPIFPTSFRWGFGRDIY